MATRKPAQILAGEALAGSPGWRQVPCGKCGKVFRWPAALAERLANSNNGPLRRAATSPRCDDCDGSADAYDVPTAKPLTPEAIGVPGGTPNQSLDRELLDWLQSDGRTLVISGGINAGKTTQLKAMVRWWLEEKGKSVLYRTEPNLMRALKDYDDGKAGRFLARACTVDLLIVDDMGTHHVGRESKDDASGWTYAQWVEILDSRFRSKRTVVATNLPIADIAKLPYIDLRVMKRLTEHGRTVLMGAR